MKKSEDYNENVRKENMEAEVPAENQEAVPEEAGEGAAKRLKEVQKTGEDVIFEGEQAYRRAYDVGDVLGLGDRFMGQAQKETGVEERLGLIQEEIATAVEEAAKKITAAARSVEA